MTTIELINELQNVSDPITWIDVDTVTDKFVEKKIEIYDTFNFTEKELSDYKNDLIEQYKPKVIENVAIIKTKYNMCKSNLNGIKNTITSFATTAVQPPAVPASPNPAWALLDAKQKVTSIKSVLAIINTNIIDILLAANKIDFEIPQQIKSIIELFKNVNNGVNKIPVG